MRRALATGLTLGLLSGFVLVVVLGLMIAFGAVSLGVAVVIVVVFTLLLLLVSPTIDDLVYRWLYGLEWIALDRLRERSPAAAAVVEDVTDEYGYSTPKFGYIDDGNPNAFTYGSGRFDARVVLTEGCFEFLDDEEVASVVAHELGHVTSRDFVVMTLANTLVQILYLIAVHAWRIAAASRASGGARTGVATRERSSLASPSSRTSSGSSGSTWCCTSAASASTRPTGSRPTAPTPTRSRGRSSRSPTGSSRARTAPSSRRPPATSGS